MSLLLEAYRLLSLVLVTLVLPLERWSLLEYLALDAPLDAPLAEFVRSLYLTEQKSMSSEGLR
jgi:hypothetical protein